MNTENNVSTVSATPNRAARRAKKAYSCTQGDLYRICYLAWLNYQRNVDAFNAFRGIYDKQFGFDRVKEIDAAKNLQNESQRNFQTSDARLTLVKAADTFSKSWSSLKEYIVAGFEGDAININLTAAGSKYLSKVRSEDWKALDAMVNNASDFVNLKKEVLMQNNNMPAAFLTDFLKNVTNCNAALQAYKDLVVLKKESTTVKVDANNEIYASMTSMLSNGQVIFKDSPKKDGFVYTKLYEIIKAQSAASIKGYMRDANGRGIPGVLIKIQKTEYTTITNKRGYYNVGRLAGQAYMMDAEKVGYITRHEVVILKAGTATHLNLQLLPVVVAQPTQLPSQDDNESKAQAM